MKIVYIAGYGRSGSSILGRVLGQQDGFVSLGEFARAGRFIADDRDCTCGEALHECAFWSAPIKQALDDGKPLSDPDSILPYVASAAGAGVLVDSSKTAYLDILRPLKYLRSGHEFYLVQLVRRPESVLRSTLRGRNRDLEAGRGHARHFEAIRTIFGWTVANTVAAVYRGLIGKRGLLVRLEDLLDDPAGTLSRIGEFVGEPLDSAIAAIESGEPLSVGHEIAGNRVLRSSSETFKLATESSAPPASFGWHILAALTKPIR